VSFISHCYAAAPLFSVVVCKTGFDDVTGVESQYCAAKELALHCVTKHSHATNCIPSRSLALFSPPHVIFIEKKYSFAYRIFHFSSNLKCAFSRYSHSVPSAKHTEQDVEALVKESLRNLQTEYIDL
jgi:hypothetical protein